MIILAIMLLTVTCYVGIDKWNSHFKKSNYLEHLGGSVN